MIDGGLLSWTIDHYPGRSLVGVMGVEIHHSVDEVRIHDQRGGDQKTTRERHSLILAYHVEFMLRVMSANLLNGRADPDDLAEIIDRLQPDVVAAQELGPNAAEVIADRLPYGLLHPAWDYAGMGLASIHPIQVRRHPLPHRDAMVAEGDLTIWTVHLANPVDFPPPVKRRPAQVGALEKAIDPDRPTLLVGDLNATPSWPAYRRLTRRLQDGVADWARRNNQAPAPTWGYRPGFPAMLRIDHALVSHAVVRSARVEVVPGSDHRALVVDVEKGD